MYGIIPFIKKKSLHAVMWEKKSGTKSGLFNNSCDTETKQLRCCCCSCQPLFIPKGYEGGPQKVTKL